MRVSVCVCWLEHFWEPHPYHWTGIHPGRSVCVYTVYTIVSYFFNITVLMCLDDHSGSTGNVIRMVILQVWPLSCSIGAVLSEIGASLFFIARELRVKTNTRPTKCK